MKTVKAISKDTDMNFGLEKCARTCLKKGRPKAKHIGSTFEKDIKDLDPRKARKYWGTDIQHKSEKEKKKECLRRRRLAWHRIKCKEYNCITGGTGT
jgi:hypothetical protein